MSRVPEVEKNFAGPSDIVAYGNTPQGEKPGRVGFESTHLGLFYFNEKIKLQGGLIYGKSRNS